MEDAASACYKSGTIGEPLRFTLSLLLFDGGLWEAFQTRAEDKVRGV